MTHSDATTHENDEARKGRIDDLVSALSLDEKVRLLTGRDFWTTWPIERIGLRRMLMSDGPAGVRGEVWDERSPSLSLPSGSALSSSWDPDIAKRYGAVSAVEARRKGVDVVLGPTINLHRSPLGGRHFEAFSEDPLLTSSLAASYVRGVQDNGVGATPKHYIANDSETDRFTVDVRVSDRALRELYLRAFEDAIVDAGAWLVMSAYNSINGATATENDLLETPLNSEWGFDGVVVSDWSAVRRVESANASQDLVMPGPRGPWGDALLEAIRSGAVPEEAIDRKVSRILLLASRVGALDGFAPNLNDASLAEDGVQFARLAAVEGSVLLRNDDTLPLAAPDTIAVIGHNARMARTQGGGSATVLPERVVTPLEGIKAAFPASAITYSTGAVVHEGLMPLAKESMRVPGSDEVGARVRFVGADGVILHEENRLSSELVYFGGDAPIAATNTFVFETDYTPMESDTVHLGFASVGTGRIFVDGELQREEYITAVGNDLGAALLTPPALSVPVDVVAGRSLRIRIELEPERLGGELSNALGFTAGTEVPDTDADQLIAEAVEAASVSDVAVVVVGTNARVESEGYDRTTIGLPGRQNDLVSAVAAANPRTVVVVNAGAPVELPWRTEVAATVLSYFGGQEYGHAVGDILRGAVEPGGRLPTTWPVAFEDSPVTNVVPDEGILTYDEGIHIGYRAWLKGEVEPAYPFGFGLGYTTWDLEDARIDSGDEVLTVRVVVQNTGARHGKHVVQVYAEKPDSVVDRPVRWLVGYAVVRADSGERVEVEVPVRVRDLQYWSEGWQSEPGEYTLRIGSSVIDLPLRVSVCL